MDDAPPDLVFPVAQKRGPEREAFTLRPICDPDREALTAWLAKRWGTAEMVSGGSLRALDRLPGFVAESVPDGTWLGLLTFTFRDAPAREPEPKRDGADAGRLFSVSWRDRAVEIVSLDSVAEGRGVGSALLGAAESRALDEGASRLWLLTTNDNLSALRFYQRRRWRIVAVHPGAVDWARRLKTSIPRIGEAGIELHDELELERFGPVAGL